MTADQPGTDGRSEHPEPPFPDQRQRPPGSESEMDPKPDYGEATYEGSGRLSGRRAVITGGDSGIGRAVALAFAREGAIVNFTKGLAQELIAKGIRVNAVAPGPVWTPLIPMSMPADTVSNFGGDSPSRRPAQPAELAPIYVFLASSAASFLVGEVIGVTGGMPIQ